MTSLVRMSKEELIEYVGGVEMENKELREIIRSVRRQLSFFHLPQSNTHKRYINE